MQETLADQALHDSLLIDSPEINHVEETGMEWRRLAPGGVQRVLTVPNRRRNAVEVVVAGNQPLNLPILRYVELVHFTIRRSPGELGVSLVADGEKDVAAAAAEGLGIGAAGKQRKQAGC